MNNDSRASLAILNCLHSKGKHQLSILKLGLAIMIRVVQKFPYSHICVVWPKDHCDRRRTLAREFFGKESFSTGGVKRVNHGTRSIAPHSLGSAGTDRALRLKQQKAKAMAALVTPLSLLGQTCGRERLGTSRGCIFEFRSWPFTTVNYLVNGSG